MKKTESRIDSIDWLRGLMAILCSIICYQIIEKPMINLGKIVLNKYIK